jgi:hypothetical protein
VPPTEAVLLSDSIVVMPGLVGLMPAVTIDFDLARVRPCIQGGTAPGFAKPIELLTTIAATQEIATIGYPAYDSRIPEPDLMERIYGKVLDRTPF